jgi:hypothetical protein
MLQMTVREERRGEMRKSWLAVTPERGGGGLVGDRSGWHRHRLSHDEWRLV